MPDQSSCEPTLDFSSDLRNNSGMARYRTMDHVCPKSRHDTIAIAILWLVALIGQSAVVSAGATVTEQQIVVDGLQRQVVIERDGYGVPTIRGSDFFDVIFGHGFAQAQDRFFQMDGTRRLAAGEVSAIAGPALLESDKAARRHRFRDVARRIVEDLNDFDHAVLEHFTAGVNAALEQMPGRLFEYSIIQATPKPWAIEDSALVLLGMFDMLQIEGAIERRVGVMHAALPEELAKFLTPRASRFDALLLPHVLNDGQLVNDWEPMPIPGPEIIDLRDLVAASVSDDLVEPAPIALGSNNWAVAAARTKDGRAIIANDPHLPYMVPGVWYRTVLEWDGGRAAGLSMPGAPGIIIGTNEHVAWGFTNMMGDFQDYIIIEVHPDDPSLYRTPNGYEPFGEIVEEIEVRGRNAERLTLRSTGWGIVTDEDWQGRPLVLKWTALDPQMVNFRILDMMYAESLDDAVDAARSWHGPSQNIVIADADGRIAWVVCGYLPKRVGFDGMTPTSWACGNVGWHGQLDESRRPALIEPEDGILFTANNRTVPLDHAIELGGIWTTGTRARRIGELINHDRRFNERDLFDAQHDTRVPILDFYRDALIDAVDKDPPEDQLVHRALRILHEWNGRADDDQPAVHLLDQFRRMLERRIISPLVAPCHELDPNFTYRWFMSDEVVMRIIEEKPVHLLPPGEDDWATFLISAWRASLESIERRVDTLPDGIRTPWGEVNRLQMAHPLAAMMPFLAERLNMSEVPQSGHSQAVRVATPRFGASARLVVSPGRLEDAILQTPAGQSGDPNSPHYRDLQEAWLTGEPTPLLPGQPHSRIRLVPAQ
jgi:penicillin G amidase